MAQFRDDCKKSIIRFEKRVTDKMNAHETKIEKSLESHMLETKDNLKQMELDNRKRHRELETHYNNFRNEMEEKQFSLQRKVDEQLDDVYQKLHLETQKWETSCKSMQKQIDAHEEKTTQDLKDMHEKWGEMLQEALALLKQEMKEHIQAKIDIEKAERVAVETQRLKSMQARLLSHEEMMLLRYDDFKE